MLSMLQPSSESVSDQSRTKAAERGGREREREGDREREREEESERERERER